MRSPKEARRFKTIMFTSIVAAVAVFTVCFFIFIFPNFTITPNAVELVPIPEGAQLYPMGDGFIYMGADGVHFISRAGEDKYTVGNHSQLTVNGDYYAIYTDYGALLYNAAGNSTVSVAFATPPHGVRAGKDMIAVLEDNEADKDYIYVYSTKAESPLIESIVVRGETVLDFGFYDATLWVLTMDATSFSPVSRVTLYTPAKQTMVTSIMVRDQLISDVIFAKDSFTIVGTNHLMCYNYKGTKIALEDPFHQGVRLIYGWRLESAYVAGQTYIAFSQQTQGSPHTAAWVMTAADAGTKFPLPVGTRAVVMGDNVLYTIQERTIIACDSAGNKKRTYAVEREILDCIFTKDKKMVMLKTNEGYSLMRL